MSTENSNKEAVAAKVCANCGVALLGPYCHACGQPEKGLVRHFGGLIGDFLDSVLSWDSRTLRTLGPLMFRPGVLTNDYFSGRRVRYVTPLRLYVFISVVLFLVLPMVTQVESGTVVFETEEAAVDDVQRAEAGIARLTERMERIQARRAETTDTEDLTDLDAREARYLDAMETAKIELAAAQLRKAEGIVEMGPPSPPDMNVTLWPGREWDRHKNPLRFDFLSPEHNEALNIAIERVINNAERANRETGALIEGIFAALPYAMFVLLPVFALILKILYLFKRRYYVEHLIVALHSHSFLFLQSLLVVLLAQLAGMESVQGTATADALGWLMGLSIAWMPLYLLIMQKRVYRQGWFFTLFKYVIIGTVYSILLTFAVFAALIAGLYGL